MAGPSRQPPLVGRDAELTSLHEQLVHAGRGEGSVALVAGEAGIGKTRLLAELAKRAQRDGWTTLSGRSYDTAGMPPYLPFREALRTHLRDCPSDQLTAQLGEDTAEVARLLPEARARLPHVATLPPATPAEARYRLFEAVSDVLIRVARTPGRAGLLMCLDDLHWADESSLLLLEHLGRRLAGTPLLVAVAYRHTEVAANPRLAHTLTHLLHLPDVGVQRLRLTRLAPAAVAELVRGLSGREPPGALVDVLEAETEGNPFFVGEVYRHLAEAGRLVDAAGAWRTDFPVTEIDVPDTVRLVVEQRLSRLSAECRRVLVWAAVIGHDFTFSLLEVVSDGGALDAVDEAQRASLIGERSDGREARYSFAHELIRQTLLAGLPRPRRQRLHLRVAQALAPLAAERDESAAELAYHLYEAGEAAEAGEAVRFVTLAGDQAVAVAAVDEGLQLYAKALQIIAVMAPGDERQHLDSELHAKRGVACASLGRWDSARAELGTALAAHPEPDARRAELLVYLCQSSFWSLDDPRELLRRHADEAVVLARAVARPDLAAAAIGWQATADSAAGDLSAAAAGFELALADAAKAGVAAPPFALQYFSLLLYWTGWLDEAARRGAEAIERFRQLNDVAGLVNVLPSQGLVLAARGRYEEAERSFREAVQLGRRHGIGTLLARAVAMSSGPRLDTFDYAGAHDLAEEARDLARTFAYAPPLISATIDLLFLAARRHELGRVEEFTPEVEAGMATAGAWHAWGWRIRYSQARAEIALARRDWSEALHLSEVTIARSQAVGRRRYEVMALDTGAAALVGLGRTREAVARLRRAVDLARTLGDPALFLRPVSALLDRAGDPTLLAEATRAAHRLADALPDQTRLLRFREAAPVRRFFAGAESPSSVAERARRALPAYSDQLSEREVEVLRLIAAGKSNPQIAAALVLSINTVERHVTHILQKTRAANRTEAAVYAARNGLAT